MEATLFNGQRVSYPIRFRRATQAVAFMNVRHAEVRSLLPRDVKVYDAGYGMAEMYLAWIQAPDTDLGSLDEVQIGFLVEDPFYRMPCTFLYANPISSEFARASGVDLWSLHKLTSRIEIQRGGGRARCAVSVDGLELVCIEGPEPQGSGQDYNSLMCVGQRSPSIVFRYLQRASSWATVERPDDVTVTTGDHPLGQLISRLRCEPGIRRYSFREHCDFLIGPPLNRLLSGD